MVTRLAGTSCSTSSRRFKSRTLSDACIVILMSLGRVDTLILITTGSPVGGGALSEAEEGISLDFDDFLLAGLVLFELLPLLVLRLMLLRVEVELGLRELGVSGSKRFVPLSVSLESSVSGVDVIGMEGAGAPEGFVSCGEAETDSIRLVGLLMQYLGRT